MTQPPPSKETKEPIHQAPTLLNPYKNTPEDRQFRLNVDIDIDDAMRIKSISPLYGTIQTIISLYVKSIISDLERANVTHYSPENYTKFANFILRRTSIEPLGVNGEGNDKRAEKGVRETHTNVAHLAADVESEDSKGLQGGGGSGKSTRKGKKA
jgi:hypothetical protein